MSTSNAADSPAPGENTAARSPHWRPLAVLGGIIAGYALLSHYSSTHPEAKGLGAGLSVGPLLLIGLALLWRWTSATVTLAVAAAIGGALWRYWPQIERNYEWADLAQQCGAYAMVAAGFARSLAPNRVPLCEQLAARVHGTLAPVETVYLRRATVGWTAFYVALTLAIPALYFAAPLRVWSLFVNFGTFGLIFLAGLADHMLRRRWLPRHATGGLLGVIRQSLIG